MPVAVLLQAHKPRLRTRRLTEMLTERIMLDETEDRLLIGSQSLLCKYALSQEPGQPMKYSPSIPCKRDSIQY